MLCLYFWRREGVVWRRGEQGRGEEEERGMIKGRVGSGRGLEASGGTYGRAIN